jgi:hypothetical protein
MRHKDLYWFGVWYMLIPTLVVRWLLYLYAQLLGLLLQL